MGYLNRGNNYGPTGNVNSEPDPEPAHPRDLEATELEHGEPAPEPAHPRDFQVGKADLDG